MRKNDITPFIGQPVIVKFKNGDTCTGRLTLTNDGSRCKVGRFTWFSPAVVAKVMVGNTLLSPSLKATAAKATPAKMGR